MSYQVLARKYRPRDFSQMVGQEHVLQALINALDHDRLHHAFLFTGTRGVGKTTIARILAKSLNCLEGVSSKPCGVCAACTEIDEGRFVQVIHEAARESGYRLRLVRRGEQAPDHPMDPGVPETRYLKSYAFQVNLDV